ncbi:MAG: CapA family protein [Deltaproteobacteria bacterium]|nr:CapA family protein [Deltaproteobacteria bacterium]
MRRLFRIVRRVGLGLAALVATVGAWALFWTLYNPDVPSAEPVLVRRPAPEGDIAVILAGDFAPTDAAMPALREHGYRWPYEPTAGIIRSADVAFANLEAPVTESDDPFPLYKKYIYKVDPIATDAWRWLGLDVVSLANNHADDYRDRGVLDTIRYLDAAGISHAGAGANETAARRAVIVDVGGTRLGFLAYLEDRIEYNLYFRSFAVGGRVGCARYVRADVEEDVRRLRPLVDVLIVSVHWGENYKDVTAEQEEEGRWLADRGVDVVAGHHAHDVQPVELRGRSVIFYSLGNYAWGTPGWPQLRVGLLARLRISPWRGRDGGRVEGVELLPIVTQNSIVHFRPRPLRRSESEWLDPFLAGSRARGTELTLDGTTIRVRLPDGGG